MRKLAILILSLTLTIVCLGQTSNDTIKFNKEIVTLSNGQPNFFYTLTRQREKELNLDTLQNGFDSLEIRISYDYSLTNFRKLIIIKRQKSLWTAIAYKLTVDWNPANLTEKIIKKEIDTLYPRHGWNNFLLKIFTLKITELPNMSNIPGMENMIGIDGVDYNIEIVTEKKYRLYNYWSPDVYEDICWQAKNMNDILKLIKKELKEK